MGGWVVQKSLKTPLHNIKMAPNRNSFNLDSLDPTLGELGILKVKSTLSLSSKLDIDSKIRPIKQASQVFIARNYLSSQTIAEEYFLFQMTHLYTHL